MILNSFLVLTHLYIFNARMAIKILLHFQVLLYFYLLSHKNYLSILNAPVLQMCFSDVYRSYAGVIPLP